MDARHRGTAASQHCDNHVTETPSVAAAGFLGQFALEDEVALQLGARYGRRDGETGRKEESRGDGCESHLFDLLTF